ncbi:MAG: ComEC family competence protein, partial [Candidatus Kaiserbacteria bacterium]|nr:ComEC family competence protein [Candidatus Kaiserbacteria bacterium]
MSLVEYGMHAGLVYGGLLAVVVGIGLETVFKWSIEVAAWLLVLAVGVGLVGRRKSKAFSPLLLFITLALTAMALGMVRTQHVAAQFAESPLQAAVGEEVSLTGVVVTEPDYRERTVHLYVQTDTDKILVTTDRLAQVSYGDQVSIEGKLSTPESFTTELGRTFNYPGYLLARGVQYTISFATIEVLSTRQGNPVIAALLSAKARFIAALQQVIPEPASGLGTGLLLGVKSALGDDIEEDFRRTGIIHIVVLSGYNVMLVVAFILFCLSFLLPLRWRLVAGVVAVAVFALVVGLSATVVRASVMAGLVLLAQFLGRRYHVLRALLFAGVVMLLLNPYLLLYDIGFQLSFMATLGLVLLLPHFESTVIEKGKSIGVREFFLSTLATQIAVLPLLMYHIGEVSLIALVVNVLVLPMVPFAMLLTFATGVVALVSVTLASAFGYIAYLSLAYILLVAEWFANIPFATIVVPGFAWWGVLLMYGVMFFILVWYQKRKGRSEGLPDWVIEDEEVVAGAEPELRSGS